MKNLVLMFICLVLVAPTWTGASDKPECASIADVSDQDKAALEAADSLVADGSSKPKSSSTSDK